MTKSAPDLRKLLESIDRRSYPAYKDARGSYDFSDYVLTIDHVQGDPFASPSKLSKMCIRDRFYGLIQLFIIFFLKLAT